MKVGLVSERKTYKGRDFFKRIFGMWIKEEIKIASNPFVMVVGILSFSKARLGKMSPRRLEKMILKEQSRLIDYGVDSIVYSTFLKELCREKGILQGEIKDRSGEKLFLKLSPMCVRQVAKECNINLIQESICIRDAKLDRISEYLMQELCFDTKNIILCTDNKPRAEHICERFYEETGLLIKISDLNTLKSDVCIDVDLAAVSFGRDLFVVSFDMGFKLAPYQAQHMDIAAHLKELDLGQIRWNYSYKKIS